MKQPVLFSLALILLLAVNGVSADDALPPLYGRIKEVNVLDSWVAINARRLQVTPQTEIRNFDVRTGTYLRAIKPGSPVFYSATPQHELLQLWIYPNDPGRLSKLLGDEFIERMY